MSDRREELHEILCALLESQDVYYQPPESVSMDYPAIVYALQNIENVYADCGVYLSSRVYSVTLIDSDPDSVFIGKLAELPTCRFDRHYKKDNLNHYVFTLYF